MAVQRWQVRDFRARRRLLDPEDFAIGGENPPPSDLVAEDVWRNVMSLPDDVAIRTTNDHGASIATLNNMWWSFLRIFEQQEDRFGPVLLDVHDEFGAALLFAIQGFYRQAAAALRTGLELTVIGAYCDASSNWSEFREWEQGHAELAFGRCADLLPKLALVKSLEAHLTSTVNDSLFRQRTPTTQGGWSRRLYFTLSNYAHSRPRFANADIWESNGPVYVPKAFSQFATLFVETFIFTTLLARLARGGVELPFDVPKPFLNSTSRWSQVARICHEFLSSADADSPVQRSEGQLP